MADINAFSRLMVDPAQRSSWITITDCEIEMAPYAHDMAHLVLTGIQDIDTMTWTSGTPVHVQWGRYPSQITNFYGYMVATNRHWQQGDRTPFPLRKMEVVCIGASVKLRDSFRGSFSNETGSSIAAQVAQSYNLSVVASRTTYAWPAKNSVGLSAWAFLAELAKADGCILACNGTTLRYTEPLATLQSGNTEVPVFYEKDSGQAMTLLEFHTDNTSISAAEGRRQLQRVMTSIGSSGESISVTGVPVTAGLASRPAAAFFVEHPSTISVVDQANAEAVLAGLGETNRFPIRAHAQLTGNVNVVQESPVVVEGLGPRDSGIWQVLTAKHRIRKNNYAVECELGRDSDTDTGQRPEVQQRYRVGGPASVPVGSRLVGGIWQALPVGAAA